MNSNKNAVLCMAAGSSQVTVIKKAKEMGFNVIAVDRNPDATGFEYADIRIILSTYDSGPIVESLKELKGYNLVGVVNRSSGPPVITVAEICKAFDLPGIKPEIARVIVSKSRLKQVCIANNIMTPDYQTVRDIAEIKWNDIKYPSVIKPSLSLVGKSGIKVARDRQELEESFEISKKLSIDGWVNIEDYISGRDIYLMSMVRGGQLIPVVLLDEINFINANMEIYGVGFAVPSILSGSEGEDRILNMAMDVISSFKLNTTPFIMCCRYDENGCPWLIEIHLDLGGDLILDELLPSSGNFDFIKFAISVMTNHYDKQPPAIYSPAAIIYSKGDGLVNERPFEIIKSHSRRDLESKLEEMLSGERSDSKLFPLERY